MSMEGGEGGGRVGQRQEREREREREREEMQYDKCLGRRVKPSDDHHL